MKKLSNGNAAVSGASSDWHVVQRFLNGEPMDSNSSFDLFISIRKGRDIEIKLDVLNVDEKNRKEEPTPRLVIPATLYDLFW